MYTTNIIRLATSTGSRLASLQNLIQPRPLSTSGIVAGAEKVNLFDLNFDRRIKVDYKDSLKYMDSEAYKKTYFDKPVWFYYKRNHKAREPHENTRPNCVGSNGFLMTSYPCVICRDEYLVLHPENAKLLKQFIDPYTGAIISRKVHGLCLKQYRNLVITITQAKDLGTLTFEIPERLYNYAEYYEQPHHCEKH